MTDEVFLASFAITAAEAAAGVTPANFAYAPMDVRRYGADPTGASFSDQAFADAKLVAKASGGHITFHAGTYKHAEPLVVDWSHASIVFAGTVILNHTGSGDYAVAIDGGPHTGGRDWIDDVSFGVGGGPIIKARGASAALWCRAVHRSHIEFNCAAAITTALQVNFAVGTDFQVSCSQNFTTTERMPVHGIKLDARNTGEEVSACRFNAVAIEGTTGDGIVSTAGQRCIWSGGTSEGNGGAGYVESGESQFNTIINMDNEANAGADYVLGGFATMLLYTLGFSAATEAIVTGPRNVLCGAAFASLKIDKTAAYTVLRDTSVTPGGFTDLGFETVYENVYFATQHHNVSIPDVERRPRMKNVGPMAVFTAANENPCRVTIGDNGLDYGDSVSFADLDSMKELNGNTYQVEPIPGTNSFYLLSGGAYVDGLSFTSQPPGGAGAATYVAFTNSWVNAGPRWRKAGFTKSADGMVTLFGNIKNGSSATSAFTLPAGFRPGAGLYFNCVNSHVPELAMVYVDATGTVTPSFATATDARVSLNGIAFRAEQ